MYDQCDCIYLLITVLIYKTYKFPHPSDVTIPLRQLIHQQFLLRGESQFTTQRRIANGNKEDLLQLVKHQIHKQNVLYHH